MEKADHCYAARRDGIPGFHAMCVDYPDMKKETAKFVAAELRRGAIVERVLTQAARDGISEYWKWSEARKSSNQLPLQSDGTTSQL